MYQLLSGVTPFDGKNIKDLNKAICKAKVKFQSIEWQNVSDGAKNFI